ncbi:TrkH family potassium uptake protein [Profundibacterium mesophilum]|uniref:Trk system potassium uptake protein n=1 Tax=Profundibacterium mesophilum KAUST100406-0324 TaxID=1037889 RepID=A0A921TEK5_9RHOB|nr:TrkH family potassium uptake protein [Profundibacterium mesophilum]KAF0677401.1 fructose-bisphosphate aldolase class I [Profundibacterium mesophilum KAUST100406-0324]
MIDLRPIGHVIGSLVVALGATMLVPMVVDIAAGNGHWGVFLRSAVITALTGGLIAIACANGVQQRLSIQQTFLLTTGVWAALPIFGAIPFIGGATDASVVDAMFEAVSGLTTTGSTVFSGLGEMPSGILLWRSMLQWFGGIGIIVVAMVFLPELRVGGMQIFRSEAFDTMGKILPRAAEIASQISWIYVGLTFLCFLSYLAVGMSSFEAINHALTTLSTGGFSTLDASFGAFQGAPEYVASVFMILASLPFVRYVQIIAGTARPLLVDAQIRAFLIVVASIVGVLATFQVFADGRGIEESLREALFNVTSIVTGTGYASVDYQLWGGFAMVTFFFIGLVGGCAGSTCCSIKIFRYQILFSAIGTQIRRIHSPHGLFTPKFAGRPVDEDALSSVMAFFVIFVVSLGVLAVLLAMTGLDFVTALSGAATAIANVGPGLGAVIGPAGNFSSLNETAKWLLIGGMLVGRLELLVVYVLFTRRFWRS